MSGTITDCITLNNDVQMPLLGFGTWKLEEGDEAFNAVSCALQAGYRHIDTAMIYHNENSVGKAIAESGLSRDDLFVTTKCWNEDMRQGRVLEAIDESLERLGMDYVDLYLLHWAVGDYVDCWKKMEQILASGKAKAVGVSNFMHSHLQKLMPTAEITPAVNQIEWHPRLQSRSLCSECEGMGTKIEAWSPLERGAALEIPAIKELAETLGKTPAQVLLKWGIQKGVVMIPKSTNETRINENAQLFDFELFDEQLESLDALDENKRMGPDPEAVEF